MPKNDTPSLKIGFVLDDSLDSPDGVQQYVLALGAWLKERGHSVHYLVGASSRTDIGNLHVMSKNIAVRFNGNRMTIPLPASKQSIKSLLDAEQFDILHIQVPYSPFMSARVIKLAQQRTVIIGTFHILPNGKVASLANSGLSHWLRNNLQRFDSMLFVSEAAKRYAKEVYRVDGTVHPNVIDYARFHSARPFLSTTDVSTILFLGRLVPRKGCMVLLRSVKILVNDSQVPPFRVVICGRGALLSKLQKFVHENQLEEIVTFTGFVSEADKPGYYASADISVFPSISGESFGIVLLEALTSGKSAVLAGDNPGYRSVMETQPQTLFDPRDPKALAVKIKDLLNNTEKRTQLAQWGEQYAKQFDINLVGAQLEQKYFVALQNRQQA